MRMDGLLKHEAQAVEFLGSVGTDCVGVIDSDEKIAAAMTFISLKQKGLAIAEIGPDGPIYRLTPKGNALLRALQAHQGDTNA